MKKKLISIHLVVIIGILMFGFSSDNTLPKVIKTYPKNGAQNVDPAIKEIWIKFDKEMSDKSYSWCYEKKEDFPELNGQPTYTENNTKNSLPVKLEPNKEYVIWINTANIKDFKDKAGNSAIPYKFTFKTK